MELSVKDATGPYGAVSSTLPLVTEKLKARLQELDELEERMYAQLNQLQGMRLAFEEVLNMNVEEITAGESSDSPANFQ